MIFNFYLLNLQKFTYGFIALLTGMIDYSVTYKEMKNNEVSFNPKIGSSYNYFSTENKDVVFDATNNQITSHNVTKSNLKININKLSTDGYSIDGIINTFNIENVVELPNILETELNTTNNSNEYVEMRTPNLNQTNFKLDVTKFGEVKKIYGYEKVKNVIESYGGKVEGLTKDSLSMVYSEDFFKSLFNDCLYFFPNSSIKLGSVWYLKKNLDFLRPVSIVIKYEFSRLNGKEVILNLEGSSRDSAQFSNMEIKLDGTVILDLESGMLVNEHTKIYILSRYDSKRAYNIKIEKTISLNKAV